MTSFHGITYTNTIDNITNMIGQPIQEDLNAYKERTQVEWEVTLEDGSTCYIYSWNEHAHLSRYIPLTFHIGARDAYQSRQVVNYLNNIYKF